MRIEVNGIHINYELSGKEGAKMVVLSHSLSSSMIMWEPQLAVLEPRFQVLRYDMRGHGQSDAPEGAYTLEQLGEDVIGLLDALEVKTVHFVGLSIGGMIGQCLGLNHAHRLDRLVLCDTTAIIPVEARQLFVEREQAAREKGMAALVQGTLERWFTPSYLQENPPEVEMIRDQVLATPVAGYVGCSQAIMGLNYLDRLSEIQLPTLIMVGEDDPGTPVSESEAIHERIPGSRLEVLPHAAHLSNIEQANAFNDHLMGFLREA
ncbi:MAG: 3-oxoadipate enol-lactonase [Desulfobacteraceae bacterium]